MPQPRGVDCALPAEVPSSAALACRQMVMGHPRRRGHATAAVEPGGRTTSLMPSAPAFPACVCYCRYGFPGGNLAAWCSAPWLSRSLAASGEHRRSQRETSTACSIGSWTGPQRSRNEIPQVLQTRITNSDDPGSHDGRSRPSMPPCMTLPVDDASQHSWALRTHRCHSKQHERHGSRCVLAASDLHSCRQSVHFVVAAALSIRRIAPPGRRRLRGLPSSLDSAWSSS